MSRESALTCIILMALLGFVQPSSAELVAYWDFDEGQGDVVKDRSGNGNDGMVIDATWETGRFGTALGFDGTSAYVEIPDHESLHLWETYTFAAWFYQVESRSSRIIDKIGAGTANGPHLDTHPGLRLRSCSGSCISTTFDHSLDEWHHAAITFDNGDVKLYLDGTVAGVGSAPSPLAGNDLPLRIGADSNGQSLFMGMIDDVRVYSHALTEAEIQLAMVAIPAGQASGPSPDDGATDVPRDGVVLSWEPGESAHTHNVYLGTVFDDVNDAGLADAVSAGQSATTHELGRLDFDQTYYWRIDEVNAPPDSTVFKGDVWSFTAEPFSIPVEAITATASSANAANMGPENTINGVGLNELDQHSTEGTEMWLSGMGDPTPAIQYAFDQPYKLDEMWVWNSNQLIESFVGIGAKDVVIEYALDGAEWTVLEGASQFAQAPGAPTYAANTAIDFGGVLAQHVRITITAGWGMLPQYGLSQVRFLYIPTFAREPQPADGEMTDNANVILNWRAGREAASHQVHLGTDVGALALAATVAESTYTATTLDYDTTYYWQITEVNEAATPTAHAGPVWRFSTPPFFTVDDFESYDDDCERIFFAWQDGIGHNGAEDCGIAPYNGNGTGSIVGHSLAPFAEQGIVHGGDQSMPFLYDSGMSEATLSFAAQDWTVGGVRSLSLYFHGAAGNTGQLYIKINNTKVVYDGATTDIASGPWKPWNIDLSAVGGNLQNVTSLTIGIENASAPGTLYLDDILLYPQAVEYIIPVEPDAASLLAHYAFDGDFSDSAGNFDGTALGNAQITSDPLRGQVLALDGDDDAVDIPTLGDSEELTISMWVNPADFVTPSNMKSTFHGDAWTAGDVHWRIVDNRLDGGVWDLSPTNMTGTGTVPYDQWSLVVLTLTPTQFAYYLNGYMDALREYDVALTIQMGDGLIGAWLNGQNVEREWAGMIDDVRIYNRALTPAEVLWLAGKTTPVAKPF